MRVVTKRNFQVRNKLTVLILFIPDLPASVLGVLIQYTPERSSVFRQFLRSPSAVDASPKTIPPPLMIELVAISLAHAETLISLTKGHVVRAVVDPLLIDANQLLAFVHRTFVALDALKGS